MPDKLNISSLKLFAGTTWSWKETPSLFPAPTYSLTIYMKMGTGSTVTLNGVADGTAFLFSKSASETSQLSHGNYNYQVIADDNNGNVSLVESGYVVIEPLLNAVTDSRSYWQKMLDLLRDAYANIAGREYTEITINGRTVRYDRAQLIKELSIAEYKVEQENKLKKGQNGNKIMVRF